jgi:hypothetical protein
MPILWNLKNHSSRRFFGVLLSSVLMIVGAPTGTALAQRLDQTDADAAAASKGAEGATIVAPPGASLVAVSDTLDSYEVRRAEDQVKRARNGFIATSAALGLGLVFLGAASSQCDRVNEQYVCSNVGKGLGTAGTISAAGGLIGMIVTGVLWPVREKKERDLRRSLHQRQPARLQWDAQSGKVVF